MPNQLTPKQLAPFCILLIGLLLFQIIGSYIGKSFLAIDSFKGYWVLSRLIAPFFLILMLSIPISTLFLSRPKLNNTSKKILIFAGSALFFIAIYLQFFAEDYLNSYRRGNSLEVLREAGSFQRFLTFTLSTLIGWEVLHRGFLLGAGIYCLEKHFKIEPIAAAVIMILIVCSFEALFHIKKPMIEAVGILIASPLLSFLTIQCRSLWPALFIHLSIEIIFGFSVYYFSFA